jgi:hypothetical protein
MIKVKLNKYDLDISDDKDAKEYEKIKETCKAHGFELFEGSYLWSEAKFSSWPSEQVIEENYLFDNQYNTVEGCRIFNWYEAYNSQNRDSKYGYYLTGDLEALKQAKERQLNCGYCGKRYSALEALGSKLVFCNACLGSEFLKESELHLLRLKAVSDKSDRQELSEAEKKELLAIFHQEQKKAHKLRIAKRLEDDRNRLKKELESLKLQSDFYSKMLDFGVYEKPIYYSHINSFVFNWQEKMAKSEIMLLQKKLKNFPFDYSIKGAENVQ